MPYAKPNNTPLYIHSKSNHPPVIIRNLPESVNKRLSDISSNEDVFNRADPAYQNALKHSGYNHELKYKPPTLTNVSTTGKKLVDFLNFSTFPPSPSHNVAIYAVYVGK